MSKEFKGIREIMTNKEKKKHIISISEKGTPKKGGINMRQISKGII